MKAVFIDIDDTMTNPQTRTIPKSAEDAVLAARRNGVLVFAATGRNTLNKAESRTMAHIEFDGYVGMNGTICHIGQEDPFYSLPLDIYDIEVLFAVHKEMGFAMSVNALREIYITNYDDEVRKSTELVDIAIPELLPKDFDYKKEAIYMLMPYVTREIEELFLPRLKNAVPTRWNDWAVDIIPAGGGKHIGLQKMMERFGLKRHEVLAMGDGHNDITMLEYAGVGVAMSHASDAVKKSADDIAPETEPVRKVFEKYGII